MKEALEQQMERKRLDQMRDAIVKIQRAVRTYQMRKQFLSQRRSAVVIQSWVRRHQARKRFNTIRRGVVRAQAHFRATRQRKLYKELREELQRRREGEKLASRELKQQVQQQNARSVANDLERDAKAMAGFNHLEIPAELAFIYSKLDDWQPIHSERNVVKVVGAVPSTDRERQLPSDLDHHAFTKFTSIYFKVVHLAKINSFVYDNFYKMEISSRTCGAPRKSRFKHLCCLKTLMRTWPIRWQFSN